MKRIVFIVVIFIFLKFPVNSQQYVSQKEAEIVASNFMQKCWNNMGKIENCFFVNNTYRVMFENDYWCIVSFSKNVRPILAYGKDKDIFEDMPCGLKYLLDWYGEQLEEEQKINKLESDNLSEWKALLSTPKAMPEPYQTMKRLLDQTGRGTLQWGQYRNNSARDSCSPSYNQACPEDEDCDCGHKPAGCGAVAMGMVMWYWQWPRSSPNMDYHWELIPSSLYNTTAPEQANELAAFLRDCGKLSDITYWCKGSWTTIQNITSSLQRLGYKSSIYHEADTWGASTWSNMIKSEIDNNRPVIYYGQPGINFTEGHYFVIDGYDYEGRFHINWGKWGSSAWCYLDAISGGGTNYTRQHHAIVGISPTYNENIISSLPYNDVANRQWRTEYAYDRILVPTDGDSLIVKSGSKVLFEAGREIELLPGFEAEMGSEVEIRVNQDWQYQMAITVPYWPNYVVWGSDGLKIPVKNANSWEFLLLDVNGNIRYTSAGTINGDYAHVWDGSNMSGFVQYGSIRFRNSYGRELVNQQFPIYVGGELSAMTQEDEIQNHLASKTFLQQDSAVSVYPNPTNGMVEIRALCDTIESVDLFDLRGMQIYSDNGIENSYYIADISMLKEGLYIISVKGRKKTYSTRIIKK